MDPLFGRLSLLVVVWINGTITFFRRLPGEEEIQRILSAEKLTRKHQPLLYWSLFRYWQIRGTLFSFS